VNWTFDHVENGFDYDNRVVILVDRREIGTSEVFKQTAAGTFTFSVEAGMHTIQVAGWVQYKGRWELHTLENDYASDAVFESTLTLSKPTTLDLVFDLRTGTVESVLEPFRRKADQHERTAGLTVNWSFTGVVKGYDYLNKMHVFIDGKRIAVTPEILQTRAGTITIAVPRGRHKLLIENYVLYSEEWQQQLKANGFAVDARYEKTLQFKKTRTVSLVFAIREGTTTVSD
jgi:hypothetical protein